MTPLSQAIAQAEALLLKASLNPSLDTTLTTAFGNNYNVTVANNIFSSWRNSNFSNLPTIEVISPIAMNGSQGAYSALNNTIYLSSSLVESKSVTAIRDVIIEEYGHFIDANINSLDSQGDEGEIWRNLVLNRKMSTAQLDTLRNENDWGTITVGDETLNVEKSVITLNVNITTDQNDGSATIGGGLSLRDAIIIANNNPTNDYIINLASGKTYSLTLGTSGEDNSLEGDLDIMDGANVTIRTNGTSRATINASTLSGNGDRVLHVLYGGALTLDKVIVTGGNSSDGGGGIYADGENLTITNSTISGNFSSSSGGGIYGGQNTTIINSTISGNSSDGGAGGIYAYRNTTIINSTISGNSATYDGGGIVAYDNVTITNSTISGNSSNYSGGGINTYGRDTIITNSTISGNYSNKSGGGIYQESGGTILLVNSTITNNVADADNNGIGDGGGIYTETTSLDGITLRNTIIGGNFDTPNNAGTGTINPDITGIVKGNANNLVGNLTGARISGTIGTGSDIVLTSGQTLGLGPLANNGGVTQTHALLTGSLAINAGSNALISADLTDIDGDGNITESVPFDQRGSGYNRVVGATVDIGAVEFQTVNTLPTLLIDDITITEGNSGTKNAVFTVTRTGTALQQITLNYATANGTTNPATAGSDYVAQTGTLSLATNETSKTISVVINGDTTLETNETFFVNLSNAVGATIADNQGLGTITNEDVVGVIRIGTSNADTLTGGNGNDTIRGFDGNDSLNGGIGKDNINGGNGSDRLDGGSENDILLGDIGNDTLIGGVGNDTLIGGGGIDSLTGGLGSDRFVFKYASEGIDRITDFSAIDDTMVISASGFGGILTANTALTSAQFLIGSAATNANQRFIYNNSTGALLFDEDGTGLIPSVRIATLNTGLALTSADIFVES